MPSSIFTPSPPPGLLPPPGHLSSSAGSGPAPAAPPGLGPPRNPPLGMAGLGGGGASHAHHQALHQSAHGHAQQQPASQQSQRASMSEWQESFKALLPNVNVRFAADLEREQSFLMG